jgi:hypothetical protein
MTTTLNALVDQCEADLSDSGNATWPAADITQWIRDAIADYSLHYPRTLNTDITTSANDRQYDLPAGFIDIVSVEYPQGEDPPEYLKPRQELHPSFWSVDGYYTLIRRSADNDVDELLISEKPDASETIRVHYTAVHDNTIDGTEALTVPNKHHHILKKYVIWQALLQLQAAEEASPTSNSSLLMSQHAIIVDRARRSYVDALAKAVFVDTKGSAVSWSGQVEETSRIY